MTNAEKFIEVMNETFGAGFTLDNLVRECSPCGALKICDMGCDTFTCDGCRKWWSKEYTAIPEQNPPITLEELRGMNDADVWIAYPQSLSGDRLIMHALVEYDSESENVWFTNNLGGRSTFDEVSEDGGLAYRRKPEWATRKREDTPK